MLASAARIDAAIVSDLKHATICKVIRVDNLPRGNRFRFPAHASITSTCGVISLFGGPAKLFGLVGVYSYGLYLIHQPYVIWLGLRIRERPIGMFLLIAVATLAVLSAWGALLEKATNTLVNKLVSRKKTANA